MKKYRDHYFKKAKEENFPARSVYKLEEIDAKFNLLKAGQKVLDLGASPGSWTMYASERVKAAGRVVSVDLKPAGVTLPDNVHWFVDDVFNPGPDLLAELTGQTPFDLVISDMAPATSGIMITDQARSYDLACQALELAEKYLALDGAFVVKIFMGPDVKSFLDQTRTMFGAVKGFKPKSSRPESKETFYVASNFQGRSA